MAKNIVRAKEFQRTLWNASGGNWTEADFNEDWYFIPAGADWDAWYEQGLAPVPLCARCGEDELSGTVWTNKHSRRKVPVNLCAACYEHMLSRFERLGLSSDVPLRVKVVEKLGAGGCCLILVLLILGAIALMVFYFLM